jgi:transcriptional regulator with XRE-family HTH domain
VRAGLTQAAVAQRMGIAQSDVSKLERRADIRLSTLQAHARAIGARLRVGLQRPEDEAPRPLARRGALPLLADRPSMACGRERAHVSRPTNHSR